MNSQSHAWSREGTAVQGQSGGLGAEPGHSPKVTTGQKRGVWLYGGQWAWGRRAWGPLVMAPVFLAAEEEVGCE